MKALMKTLSLTATAILLATISMWAQQPNTNTGQQMQGMQMSNGQAQGSQKMSKNQMMQSCHRNMQSMMKSNAQTTKDIEAAKQSNDPAKMRAALDEAEKALSPMNEHMKTCMRMMNMMQNMHGMGGMMQDQGNSSQPK